MTIVGVISDTHGLLRSEALEALAGSDLIIHAGDIGDVAVLDGLRALAPVVAVRGNNDRDRWALDIPCVAAVDVGGARFHVLHILGELDLDPQASGFHVVVSGHSHQPKIETRDGVLYLNPGSAGPRRFRLPVSLARVEVSNAVIRPQIIELSVASSTRRLMGQRR